jgi:V/A-type H+-transporting ATPase subunit C
MAPAERYGYTVARLRAMGNRLLDESAYQRILDSEDLESALKVLGETVYSSWIVDLKSSRDFDQAIEAELLHVYSEIEKFVPDKRLVEVCRLPYDFHNIKVLIKSHILQKEGKDRRFNLLTPLGNIPKDDLIMAVESEDYRLLPYGLHTVLPGSLALWEQTKDILEVEKDLDNQQYALILRMVVETGIASAIAWAKAKIDAENLRNGVRLRRVGMDVSSAASYFHDGGFISKERLLALLPEPLEGWAKLICFADAGVLLGEMKELGDMNHVLVEMERLLDNYITGVLSKAKYGAFSEDNVMQYLWSKEIEAKNVRILLVSVANNTNRELARGLLRNVR